MSRLVLGIDGGGTKTAAACLDIDTQGLPLVGAIGHAGPGNIANLPVAQVIGHIQEALAATMGGHPEGARKIVAVCAGVAGASFGERREELAQALARVFPGTRVEVVPDYVAASTGALAGQPGMVVIAGTGSVAYGENAAGLSHRAGGYGYVIDDSGSGYGVGRRALAAVLHGADGTEQRTSLAERIAAELGSVAWDDLVAGVFGGTIDPARIAALTPAVALAARQDNDHAAQSILMHAGGALARMAEAVALSLFAQNERFTLATIGSLWEAGSYLSDVFYRSLLRFAPAAQVAAAKHDPATGAALRAAALLNSAA
jgi:N-acetylglucosamine kinase-like BadF-type ATPase